MTTEQLIESVRDIPTITRLSHVVQIEKIGELRDALIAAEKAHTPTDDEREARWSHPDAVYSPEVFGAIQELLSEAKGSPMHALRLAVSRQMSEVPEPSVEEWAGRIRAARAKALAKGYTPEHDRKHGIRHLLNWAIDYARRGRAEDSSGLMSAAMDLAEIAYAELERLRHVADTMSAVSEPLRTRYASDSQAAYFMRQIDEAALPAPQGEPYDALHSRIESTLSRYETIYGGMRQMRYIIGDIRKDLAAVTEQGEPSDAQAALKAWSDYWDRDEGGNDMDAMRAALRAAGGVR